jgi:hypothetical protein
MASRRFPGISVTGKELMDLPPSLAGDADPASGAGVATSTGEGPLAGHSLVAAYPDERRRAHATRWLGWIAYHMGAGRDLAWWEIPAWIPRRWMLLARGLTACVTLGAALGVAVALVPVLVVCLAGLLGVYSQLSRSGKRRAPEVTCAESPRAVVSRWPRWRELGRTAVLSLRTMPLVVTFMPLLAGLWVVPAAGVPAATAASAYRSDRRASLVCGLAWTLNAVPAAGVVLGLGLGPGRWLGVVLVLALAAGVFFGFRDGPFALVKLAELVLLVQWRERVRFERLLEDAAGRRVLVQAGTVYVFRDAALQTRLAAMHQAALAERGRQRAVQSARTGARSRLAAFLSRRTMARISVDLGAGAGIAVAAGMARYLASQRGFSPGAVFDVAGSFMVAGLPAFAVVAGFLRGLAWSARWSLVNVGDGARRRRLAVLMAVGAGAALIIWGAGRGAVRAGLAAAVTGTLPAAFVAGCGIWACLLVHRRVRTSAHRWLRLAPDPLAAAAAGAGLLVLADRNLLETQPAAGLLFPPAAWVSIRIWRAMNGSRRLVVRAGADITLSLILGGGLVLLLVWTANLLDLPRPEVAALRGVLGRAGSIADLPWWLWTGLYVLLAGASLAFALWPGRLTVIIGWFGRLHVVPAAEASRRVLTGVHIGLLSCVLIGLTAPPALDPAFRGELKASYTVALQRELAAQGELAAYAQIRREFTARTPPPAAALAGIVLKIHDISSPPPGGNRATSTEADLARRLGELQAMTLALKPPPSLPAAEQAAAGQAGFGAPLRDEPDLRDRLAKLDAQENKDDDVARRADQAGELAAAALAGTISIPHISNNEIIQVVREYLSGLIEDSPLKDVFAAWARRLTGRTAPPAAGQLAIPDPGQLKRAASGALAQELASQGLAVDPALTRARNETPAAAVVDLINQQRTLQENGGHCDGCIRPENPGEQPGQGPEDHPAEP